MRIKSANTNTIWLKFFTEGISTTLYRITRSCERSKTIACVTRPQKDQTTPITKNFCQNNSFSLMFQSLNLPRWSQQPNKRSCSPQTPHNVIFKHILPLSRVLQVNPSLIHGPSIIYYRQNSSLISTHISSH